jgi:SAM-dependent methyltransferase
MSAEEFYDALAPVYHLNYADWSASIPRQAAALDEILRNHGIQPPASILDAACGIGTQSLGLATLGYDVTGSDISAQAVARAQLEAAARSLSIPFSIADIRSAAAHHQRTYDAVIACDNAIPHLLSDSEILTAFNQLHECTRPGGICLISVRDYDAEDRSRAVQARPPLVHVEGDKRRIVFQVWAFENSHYELSLYIIDDHTQHEPEVQVVRTRYYAVGIETLKELMKHAGFVDVQRLDEPFYQPVIVGRRPVG